LLQEDLKISWTLTKTKENKRHLCTTVDRQEGACLSSSLGRVIPPTILNDFNLLAIDIKKHNLIIVYFKKSVAAHF